MTRFGFLSSFSPTKCGIATFNAALLDHLIRSGSGYVGDVVRVRDADDPVSGHPLVAADVVNGTAEGPAVAAGALNQCDVAVIQHEYGIYGGRDGEEVLQIVQSLEVPTIAVVHTVLSEPDAHQRQILERLADAAWATVVMSETAAQRLRERYLVDSSRLSVIPHGAPSAAYRRRTAALATDEDAPSNNGARPTILSWGLLGPGKGLEWAIDAVGLLRARGVEARYLIAGRTHPKVVAHSGESYRDMLRDRAEAAGVADLVEFDADYRDTAQLMDLVHEADAVLLPYESTEQVTSGVLIEAVAAARPVVATAFPHARELLSDGAGLLVPQRDAAAMAQALGRVLTQPGLAGNMAAQAERAGADLRWSAVAERYRRLALRLMSDGRPGNGVTLVAPNF
jgi:polysaccharide biosynthesis protein PslF